MNIAELDCNIKKELRASMNGILSARMRKAGMPYHLIFGVELPRLQNIAKEFSNDVNLANHLWKENIRETRLLAIMLMPAEAFTPEMANAWAKALLTAEEAQVMAMLLLSKTKYAKEISMKWLEAGEPLSSTCACLCMRHLLVQDVVFSLEEKKFISEYTSRMLPTANLHLKKAIQTLTEFMVHNSEQESRKTK